MTSAATSTVPTDPAVTKLLQIIPSPQSIGVSATAAHPKEKNVTMYVVMIKWGKTWTVSRRFSEFEALREKLVADLQTLPALPPKTYLWQSVGPELIAKRKTELDAWLNVVRYEPYVLNSPHFHAFLQLTENAGSLLTKLHLPKEITHFEDTQFGVNAMVYDDKSTVIFTACGDPSAVSRLDSKLSNMQMPWQKKGTGAPTTMVPIGSLSCWKESQSIYKLACSLFFESEVTCVAWDPTRRYVMIGLDSGKIQCYFINEAFSEFNAVKTIATAHSERVVSLIYDPKRDVMVSASRDKKINIFNVKNFELITSEMCGKAWLSCMTLDTECNRAFVGNYAQQIGVYDLSTKPPTLVHILTGHTGSLRCIAYHEREHYLFSSGFDGISGVWSIPPNPKDVTRSRSIGWLSGGPAQKIKSITYYPAAKQVLTGLESGGICIWDTDSGKLLHNLSAHTDAVVSLEFVEHKRMLVSGARDGRVKLWQFPKDPNAKTLDIQPFSAASSDRKLSAGNVIQPPTDLKVQPSSTAMTSVTATSAATASTTAASAPSKPAATTSDDNFFGTSADAAVVVSTAATPSTTNPFDMVSSAPAPASSTAPPASKVSTAKSSAILDDLTG